MSRYTRRGRECEERIEYYNRYAVPGGAFRQARYWWNLLLKSADGALWSKNDQRDVPVIRSIIQRLQPKIEEMKRRDDEYDAARERETVKVD